VAHITQQQLHSQLSAFVLRTERGNDVVRSNPRDLPRRLRVLLLSIDGNHTVRLYVETLKGFGDITVLLIELMALSLIELRSPSEVSATPAASTPLNVLDNLLDDSRFNSQSAAELLFGNTTPGSFEDMLRVANVQVPNYQPPPPPPPPAPISSDTQQEQIESLYRLLDKLRGERSSLKSRVAKMERLRAKAQKLDKENQRLYGYVFALSTACVAMAVTLGLVLLRS
jgi:hypothetical protein